MIIVHHLEHSRSQRLVWLLEELDQSYHIVTYRRDPVTRFAPSELARIHPLGKSPVIEHDGVVLAETGAIFDHLCAGHDRRHDLSPPTDARDSDARAWRYWLHYAEGSAMPVLAMKLVLAGVDPAAARTATDNFVDPQLRLHADHWERSLAATGWLAGERFSAADIIMSFPIEVALSRFANTLGARPILDAYIVKLRERPAYQRALHRIADAS